MPLFTTVIRHYKERISKCSLRHLHDRKDMVFLRWIPEGFSFDATGYILLSVDGDELSPADATAGKLLLLDSTWRLLPQIERSIMGTPIKRKLPSYVKTAYPRASKISQDPLGGLASVEALYLAKKMLGETDPSLLDLYEWKDAFLEQFR